MPYQAMAKTAAYFSFDYSSPCVRVCSLSREPVYGYTPLMEAAASGHEIIVQYLLNHVSVQTGLCKAETLWFQLLERKNHKFDCRFLAVLCLILDDSHL